MKKSCLPLDRMLTSVHDDENADIVFSSRHDFSDGAFVQNRVAGVGVLNIHG